MADRALACARMLHGATGARLDLLHIAPARIPGVQPPSGPTLGATSIRDGAPTVDHGTDVDDDPVRIILHAVERRRPDLVVMASDHWSGVGWVVDVARRSPVPVLVVPTGPDSPPNNLDVRRILVALDGSEQAEHALTPARALAGALGADMLLLRVVAPKRAAFDGRSHDDDVGLAAARRYVEDLADAVPSTGTMVSALAVVGEPGTMIAAVSRTQRAGLLAMTTRGKRTAVCSALGGVAARSLRSAGLPLLLVPPSARSTETIARRR
jgi:nucleotide-binding universal stress UspA family protein